MGDDVLNLDMANALEAIELDAKDKELLRSLLFQERNNKDREWGDDAADLIVRLLEKQGLGNDLV